MIYTITLDEMEFKAYHGCYDLEKLVGNRFLVSISLDAELDEAAHHQLSSGICHRRGVHETEIGHPGERDPAHHRGTVCGISPAPPCPRDGIQARSPSRGQNTQGFRNTLPIKTLQIVNRLLITKRQEAGRSGKLDLNLHLAATDRPSQ